MNRLLVWLTGSNAALFLFCAAQHAGIAFGPFREPRIVPAALVETVCGVALAYAAAALVRQSMAARRATVISNLIALAGVAIGLVALAIGAGPRTASNDFYHRLMLALIGISFVVLYLGRPRAPAQRTS
jgi:hypothetical protein